MSDKVEVDELCVLLKSCLACNYPKQTTLNDLSRLYKSQSSSDLKIDIMKRGYNSLESFLKSNPETFTILKKGDGYNTIVKCREDNDVFADKKRPQSPEENNSPELNASDSGELFWSIADGDESSNSNWSFCKSIKPESEYKTISQDPPLNLSRETTFDIEILDAFNPQRFWFVRCEEFVMVDHLLRTMTKFYSVATFPNKTDKCEDMQVGDIVAVEYSKLWHRGKVLELNAKTVKIFFIDFGTTEIADISRIRKLHPKFYKAPIYLKRGTLIGIESQLWCKDATKFFIELVGKHQLKAKICKYDPQHRVYFMNIKMVDKNDSEKEQWVNDILCEKNFGEYSFKIESNTIVENFEDLENGRYITENLVTNETPETAPEIEENKIEKLISPPKENSKILENRKVQPKKGNPPMQKKPKVLENGRYIDKNLVINETAKTATEIEENQIEKLISPPKEGSTILVKEKVQSKNENHVHEQSFVEKKFLLSDKNGIRKNISLKSSGIRRQIFPQSLAMFKENSVKEIVIHSIDESTLEFKFFLKDELNELSDLAWNLNESCKSKKIKCIDFTIENDVAVFHDNNYCRGRIISVSQDGTIEVDLLDFGYTIARPHYEIFKLDEEWMKKRSFIFSGCLDLEQRKRIDYDTFKLITKNKIVKSQIKGRAGMKVELVVKELFKVTAEN